MDQRSPSGSAQKRAFPQQPQPNGGPSEMFGPPPAKRARLSPNPVSPHAQSPQSPFSPVVSPSATNSLRPPNGVPEPGGMGPPQRPTERERTQKHTDVNELSDLVTGSGVDLRQEEDYLANTYRTDRGNVSFQSQASQSFSPQNSFDILSQGSLDAGHGSFTTRQPQQSIESELFDRHKKAARDINEQMQWHLTNPFLWGASVRKHMERISNDNGMRLPMDGLFDKIPDSSQPQHIRRAHAQGSNGGSVTAAFAPSILNVNAPLEPILTLLSLAANDRIRSLLEDAYGLARGRQSNADGVVPPEWSDLAVGNNAKGGAARHVSVTKSPWDAQPDAHGQANALPSPPNSNAEAAQASQQPQPTVTFPKQNALTSALVTLSRQDRQAEEARLKKRADRRAKKLAQNVSTQAGDASTPGSTPAAGGTPQPTPGPLNERAPDQKMSKKERERLAKQDLNEATLTRNANTMAAMQLGGKQYSWMSAASTAKKPSLGPRATATPSQGAAAVAAGGNQGLAATKDRKFGEFREDGPAGRGIQLRDWVSVLEADGRERKALSYAYVRLGRDRAEGNIATPSPGPAQANASAEGTRSMPTTPAPAAPSTAATGAGTPSTTRGPAAAGTEATTTPKEAVRTPTGDAAGAS